MMFCEAKPFQNADHPRVHRFFRGKQHVHLLGDDEQELMQFARSIGMRETWAHRDSRGIPHFDCTDEFMAAVNASPEVKKLSRREFVEEYRRLKGMSFIPRSKKPK